MLSNAIERNDVSTPARTSEPLAELATRAEVSEYLQISTSRLAQWAMVGQGPKVTKLGPRHVRYRRADVLAWVDAQAAAS